VGIHLAVEHALELEPAHAAFEAGSVALDVERGGLVVFAFSKLQQLRGIRDALGGAIELRELGGQLRPFAAQFLRPLGLRPDSRVFQLEVDLFEAFLLAVVIKETP
jgi:hypothetical protein